MATAYDVGRRKKIEKKEVISSPSESRTASSQRDRNSEDERLVDQIWARRQNGDDSDEGSRGGESSRDHQDRKDRDRDREGRRDNREERSRRRRDDEDLITDKMLDGDLKHQASNPISEGFQADKPQQHCTHAAGVPLPDAKRRRREAAAAEMAALGYKTSVKKTEVPISSKQKVREVPQKDEDGLGISITIKDTSSSKHGITKKSARSSTTKKSGVVESTDSIPHRSTHHHRVVRGSGEEPQVRSEHEEPGRIGKIIRREPGTVESYDRTKGFGFIISSNPPEGEPTKIFVYHTHIKTKGDFRYLKPGYKLSFVRGWDNEKALPCCLDVRNRDLSLIDNDDGTNGIGGILIDKNTKDDNDRRKKISEEMKNWRNHFEHSLTLKLDTKFEFRSSFEDSFIEGSIQYIGSGFIFLKSRFGDEVPKFLKEKFFQTLNNIIITTKDPDAIVNSLQKSDQELEKIIQEEESDDENGKIVTFYHCLNETIQQLEDEFQKRAIMKKLVDGCEISGIIYQHQVYKNRSIIRLHTFNIGANIMIACDRFGKAVKLNDPHIANSLSIKQKTKFGFEPSSNDTTLSCATSGFSHDGVSPSIEYWLPASRIFGARPFKKSDTGMKLSHLPELKQNVRVYDLKNSSTVPELPSMKDPSIIKDGGVSNGKEDLLTKDLTTDLTKEELRDLRNLEKSPAFLADLFYLILSPELGKWISYVNSMSGSAKKGEQGIIDLCLDMIENGKLKGEIPHLTLPKSLLQKVMGKGAPGTDLSCLCIFPRWQQKNHERLIENKKRENRENTIHKKSSSNSVGYTTYGIKTTKFTSGGLSDILGIGQGDEDSDQDDMFA